MKKRIITSLFLIPFILIISGIYDSSAVFADDERELERISQRYDDDRYTLMTHADDKFYQWAQKTGTGVVNGVKNLLWSINVVISRIGIMIIYQLFSLDIVELTKDSVSEIVSGTAGTILNNMVMFAFAVAVIGIVIRSYFHQNWQEFFKVLTTVVISIALLFSIQTKKFDYIEVAHGISLSFENAIMKINPSLTNTDVNFEVTENEEGNANIAEEVAIEMENKAFESLLYKPYLLLQYGSTDEKEINAEESFTGDENRIEEYLSVNPLNYDGKELRDEIAEYEFSELENENIFAGAGFKSSAYIVGVIITSSIQIVILFFLALMRIMLQFAFIFMLLLVPFMLFMSLFPSLEGLLWKYMKGFFILIMGKALVMFFILVATSFIVLSYEMTDASSSVYYRIFIQSIFSISILLMYMKRDFIMNMLEGASPSFSGNGGQGFGRNMIDKGRHFGRHFVGSEQSKGSMSMQNMKTHSLQGDLQDDSHTNKLAKKGITKSGVTNHDEQSSQRTPNNMSNIHEQQKSSKEGFMSKFKNMKRHIGSVQSGDIPNYRNPYKTESDRSEKTPNNKSINNNLVKKDNEHKSKRNTQRTSAAKVSSLSKGKHITQWEAYKQIQNNNTSRNPYYKTEQQKAEIKKRKTQNNNDGLLNKRSLLHNNKNNNSSRGR